MSEGSRICPLCDALTDADVCPNDGVQTMDRDRFDKSKRGLQPGTVIAGRFKVDCFLGAGAMGGVY
ncbi:MAG: hypothetical protein VYE15_04495, partial [Myxococcota bacterium]|nr:hypothetical protein [Myxococcota bacterium]